MLAVAFFFTTLGLPWVLGGVAFYLCCYGTLASWAAFFLSVALLALHPLPQFTRHFRSSRLALALTRYFTVELIIDRDHPLTAPLGTPAVDTKEFREQHLPALYLACPHGVFNYGAIVWCCFGPWLVGGDQVTGAASAVANVPGLRYLAPLIWLIASDRKSIVNALRSRGGTVGMVPDGILGAFRTRPGHDELVLGKKRGLMRIATEEGATVLGAWFFGTTDMLTVLQDPWGLMETASRKMQTGFLGYYGRWGTPVPRRIACSMSLSVTLATKIESPTSEQVEALHQQVYGVLGKQYEKHKAFAGYPTRSLVIT